MPRGISPHIGFFPIENRVEFGDAARVVGFFEIQMAAAVCLAAALAGEPGGRIGERTVQRLDFADVAALPAPLDVLVNRGGAVFALECGGGFGQRAEHFDGDAVARIGVRNQGFGFGIELAGVECDDADGQRVAADLIGDNHVFDGEARGQHGTGKALGNVLQALGQRGFKLVGALGGGGGGGGNLPKFGLGHGHLS